MNNLLAVLGGAAVLMATALPAVSPAAADGWRRAPGPQWRSAVYEVPISRNVITPYYYPYYGHRYSYVRPDPVPPPTYVVYPALVPVCWAFGPGLWAC
jgi:hypothetical protein